MGATDESPRNLNRRGVREANDIVDGKAWSNFVRDALGTGLRSFDIDEPKIDSGPWCYLCKKPNLFFEVTRGDIAAKATNWTASVAREVTDGRCYLVQYRATNARVTYDAPAFGDASAYHEVLDVPHYLTALRWQRIVPSAGDRPVSPWILRDDATVWLQDLFTRFHTCDLVVDKRKRDGA